MFSMIGGIASGMRSLVASNKQSQAQAAALAQQKQMYNQTRNDLAPFRNMGTGAGNTLAQLYGISPDGSASGIPYSAAAMDAFKNAPDYQFALREGINALTNQNASKGILMSGSNLKDIMGYSSGLASQNFQNYANRLLGMTQVGAGAAAGTAQVGAQYSGQMSNSLAAQGQAQAGGIVGATNAFNNGLQNWQFMNNMNNRGSAYVGNPNGNFFSGSSPVFNGVNYMQPNSGFMGVGASPY
jgi:hypothetical protein